MHHQLVQVDFLLEGHPVDPLTVVDSHLGLVVQALQLQLQPQQVALLLEVQEQLDLPLESSSQKLEEDRSS
jgi:hypothetical protein